MWITEQVLKVYSKLDNGIILDHDKVHYGCKCTYNVFEMSNAIDILSSKKATNTFVKTLPI